MAVLIIFAQASSSGDFLAGHMPEIKAIVERATAPAWNQTAVGQIVIGLAIAGISGLFNHLWGFARGFERGRRRQQADSDRFLQAITGDASRKLLPPPEG